MPDQYRAGRVRRFILVRPRAPTAACLAAAAAIALPGCGESEGDPAGPLLPRALAGDLAARSDAVAMLAASGRSCEAAAAARRLQRRAESAIAAGAVPAALAGPLGRAIRRLESGLRCVPPLPPPPSPSPPPPPPDAEEEEEEKEKKKKKKKKNERHDGKGDERGKEKGD
ncbi:MAG: hypothetical protein ABR521_12060 [Gaiellaceae bacterium]